MLAANATRHSRAGLKSYLVLWPSKLEPLGSHGKDAELDGQLWGELSVTLPRASNFFHNCALTKAEVGLKRVKKMH